MTKHTLDLLKLLTQTIEEEVTKFGYTEDEICALDLEEDHARFFMSDGKILKIYFKDLIKSEEDLTQRLD